MASIVCPAASVREGRVEQISLRERKQKLVYVGRVPDCGALAARFQCQIIGKRMGKGVRLSVNIVEGQPYLIARHLLGATILQ